MVVAGDITAEEIKPLAEIYYGKIPPSRTAAAKKQFFLPYPVRSKIEMRHPQIKLYSLQRVYVVPSYLSENKEQSFAYTVLDEILGAYHLGKMYNHFITGKKTARSAGTSYGGFALDKGTFGFFITARDNESLVELEKELEVLNYQSERVHRILDNLKPWERKDLEKIFLGRKKYSDLAKELGFSETKVKGMFDLAILQAVKKYEDSI